MENEFIPYKQALALSKLGFDEPCLRWFKTHTKELLNTEPTRSALESYPTMFIKAPLYQQAFKWFRKEYGLHGRLDYTNDLDMDNNIFTLTYYFFVNKITDKEIAGYKHLFRSGDFPSYKKAELECLKKLIEICKE